MIVSSIVSLARGCYSHVWPGRCDKHPVSGTPEECWRCMDEKIREMAEGLPSIKIVPMRPKSFSEWKKLTPLQKKEIMRCVTSLRS